jgi:hypothetical protein
MKGQETRQFGLEVTPSGLWRAGTQRLQRGVRSHGSRPPGAVEANIEAGGPSLIDVHIGG